MSRMIAAVRGARPLEARDLDAGDDLANVIADTVDYWDAAPAP